MSYDVIMERYANTSYLDPGVQIKYAGFGKRVVARLIDVAILFVILHIIHRWIQGSIFAVANIAISETYFVSFWGSLGATPGKLLLKQRIVTLGLEPIDVTVALKRALIAVFSDLLFGIPYMAVLFSSKKQGLHDRFANTYVICC